MSAFLDIERLEAVDAAEFRSARPFPWLSAPLLTEDGYAGLLDTLPELSVFEAKMGKQRRGGQAPHDRYSLEYTEEVEVSPEWRTFIGELRGERYRNAMARLYDAKRIEFRFHWHYTPASASVSPHCDSIREHGSHIFYFNDARRWDPDWGGQTLVLDDGGRLDRDSGPKFEDFDAITTCEAVGNTSMLFNNNAHAWHGVRAITCPEGEMRKVFIVVVNPDSLFWKVRDRVIGKTIQRF